MEFHPSLRFAVMSDIHLKDCPSVERLRLRQPVFCAHRPRKRWSCPYSFTEYGRDQIVCSHLFIADGC